jgi:hypothetical protein
LLSFIFAIIFRIGSAIRHQKLDEKKTPLLCSKRCSKRAQSIAPDIAAEVLVDDKSVCHFADEVHPKNVERIQAPKQAEKPPMLGQVAGVLDGNSHTHKHRIVKASKNVKRNCKYGEKQIFKGVLVTQVVANLGASHQDQANNCAIAKAQRTLAQYKNRSGPSATTVIIIRPTRMRPT